MKLVHFTEMLEPVSRFSIKCHKIKMHMGNLMHQQRRTVEISRRAHQKAIWLCSLLFLMLYLPLALKQL